MTAVIPLLLSGGAGTRLWPLSRASRPKQFLAIGAENSLFQQTVQRCSSSLFDPRPIVVGGKDHRFLIAESLDEIGVSADILLEPVGRNSCAAIAAGCLQALGRDSNAVVLVLASDHHIPDGQAFGDGVAAALPDALNGHLLTFGIRPDRPATGYGYIRPGEQLGNARKIAEFTEKPDEAAATRYISEGCLWNSGNFLFHARTFIDEVARLQPEIMAAVEPALREAVTDLDFIRLEEKNFTACPSISVDYAIMEKTHHAAVLPVEYEWSDIGSWDAVANLLEHDENENAVVGAAEIMDGSGNLVHSPHALTTMIGIDNTVVAATRDCILVADRTRAEDVKSLVELLRRNERPQADAALQIFRPWGDYEQLDAGQGYQVKRITVKPGGELSLQKHRHRAEHWVVVQGQAEVTIGDRVTALHPNQSTYIPLGEIHRLANRGSEPVILIEVQTGDYLGEDDIIRLDDRYNRSSNQDV